MSDATAEEGALGHALRNNLHTLVAPSPSPSTPTSCTPLQDVYMMMMFITMLARD